MCVTMEGEGRAGGTGEAGHCKQGHPPDLASWASRGSFLIIPGMTGRSGACNHRLMQLLGMTARGWRTPAHASCG